MYITAPMMTEYILHNNEFCISTAIQGWVFWFPKQVNEDAYGGQDIYLQVDERIREVGVQEDGFLPRELSRRCVQYLPTLRCIDHHRNRWKCRDVF